MAKQPETKVKFSIFNEEFNEGIKEISDESKKLKKEFKLQSEQMKNTASETDKLRKRIEYLGCEQDNVRQKIGLTEKQLEKAKQTYGENSKEANTLSNRLLDLQISEQKLENAIDHSKSALQQQSREMVEARNETKKYEKALEDVGDGLTNFGQTMTAAVTAPILAAGTLAVETTREFREDLARLETNAKQAGVGIDTTRKAMKELNAVTGETDSSVEGLSNLMATGMNDNQLLQAVEDLSGAVIKFPDTLKFEGLSDGLQETLATKKAIGPFAELLERMGKDLEEFDEGLTESAESGDELNYVLNELSDLDLSKVVKEYRNANKEIVEGREAQYDFMEAISELGEKLEPIATRVTESVTDIVDSFNDLEPEVQDNILKMVGFAAAVGPASTALGGMTKILGKVGGAGLIASLASMGPAGIVGLAIAGVTGLGFAIAETVEATKKHTEVNFDAIEAQLKEIETTDKMIDRFKVLETANKLSTDEMLRFMDINSELAQTSSPDKIAELKDEQDRLLGKSTLTNDEMIEFIDLNNQIIEKSPETQKAISDQGNAYAETTEQIEKMNAEQLKATLLENEKMAESAATQLNEKLEEQQELISGIEEASRLLAEYSDKRDKTEALVVAKKEQLKTLEEELNTLSGKELLQARNNYNVELQELQTLEEQLFAEDAKYQANRDQYIEKSKGLDKSYAEIKALETQLFQYEDILLDYLGINAEKGKGLEALDKELDKLNEQKQDLIDIKNEGKMTTDEYNEQNQKLDEQKQKLLDAKEQLKEMNEIAGRTIYQTIEREVRTSFSTGPAPHNRNPIATYAKGTDFHPGGPAIVGEEGPELVRQGNKWSLHSFGLIPDLKVGADVFTAEQTKKILMNLPAYASGVGVGTSQLLTNRLNDMSTNLANQQSIKNDMTISIEASDVIIDSHVVGRVLWKPVKENMDRDERRNSDIGR